MVSGLPARSMLSLMYMGSPWEIPGGGNESFIATSGRRYRWRTNSAPPGTELLANSERVDEGPVALEALLLEIVEQPAALTDDLEQPAARVVILRVGLEVLGQVVDPLRQERDLDLGRTGVAFVGRELGDGVLLAGSGQGHSKLSFYAFLAF